MDADLSDWLVLNRLPSVVRGMRLALAEGRVDPHDILSGRALRTGAGDAVAAGPARPSRRHWQAVEADLAWLSGPRRHLLVVSSPTFPERLRQIPDPPLVLFVEGDPEILSTPQIAMVGSRRATPPGLETAHALAAALAGCGLTVTSGLALGIDAASHRGALWAGGATVAVAANGLDLVYPARHRRLAARVAECGAMVSEFSPGRPPLARHFPRRNRLISGLALGVVVVEAARRSGSLITARLAGEQGREVFAVPGSIHNPLARGCHHLIRDGAKLVESADDILEELLNLPEVLASFAERRAVGADTARETEPAVDGNQQRVLDCLGYAPTTFDTVVDRSGLTPQAVSSILLALELRGLVAAIPGGAYTRVTKRQ